MRPQTEPIEITTAAPAVSSRAPRLPRLETGDHLTREEFERRYDAMPELKKAELIEGVVYMPSPVRREQYGSPRADLITWLGSYRAATSGVRVSDNATVRLDLDNEPQPDAVLYMEAGSGSQACFDAEEYMTSRPELVAEIAASTVSIAHHTKLHVYRRNNIREYIIWRVEDGAIDWFVLCHGQYEQLERTAEGWLRSEQLPGLWLDPDALLRFDLARVLQVLQQGLASPEHTAFIAQLQQRAAARS